MLNQLAKDIKTYGQSIGLSDIGITDIDLSDYQNHYQEWVEAGYHGSMSYMTKHGEKRWRPEKLIDNTLRVISFRINYWQDHIHYSYVALPKIFTLKDITLHPCLTDKNKAYISRYALGRDYHKVLRSKGKQLITFINNKLEALSQQQIDTLYGHEAKKSDDINYRVFVDSAPVLEKPLAEKAGLGWIGKHSNLINKNQGSWFFLGEIFTNLPLPIDSPMQENHCGSCTRFIQACPTNAIIKPYVVDAKRCISYLTIEHHGAIPVELRSAMGNRIYGCDDCQLVCPWNSFTQASQVDDFKERHHLSDIYLLDCFAWDEKNFLKKTEGSPIRRIGYLKWLSNIAIALGNALPNDDIIEALNDKKNIFSNQITDTELADNHTALLILLEHIDWAIAKQTEHS